eukprot:7993306-Alexandrium_andersonii.AAC.1
MKRNLTHYPFKDWCSHCIKGRGNVASHQSSKSHLPVVQFEFTFPKFFTNDDITILTGIDVATGLSTAALLPGKTLTGHAT